MADIKTRENIRDIKILDKSGITGERVKTAFIRSKDQAQNQTEEGETSPSEYAENQSRYAVVGVVGAAGNHVRGQIDKKIKESYCTYHKHRHELRAEKKLQNVEKHMKHMAEFGGKTVAKSAQKSVKRAERGIKTAQKTSKTAIKTTDAVVKVTRKTTVATAKAAAKAIATTAKAVAKATVAAAKAIVAGGKALIAALAAGGWIAVLIIVILCVVALIIGSCFGIFFPDQESGSGQTIYEVVQELEDEYQDEIDTIKANNTYDEIEISDVDIEWPEVLSVYAVMVMATTNSSNIEEMSIITEEKKELLRKIFWEMNAISHSTTTNTEPIIVESEDGNGNVLEEEVLVTITTLNITISQKRAMDLVREYTFNIEQKEQLKMMLENNNLWCEVLYGFGGSGEE